MANSGANKNKRKYQQPPAEERYDKLEVAKKLACFRFWTHLVEKKETKIWNPDRTPGSIWNYRSSLYLQSHIKEVSWSNTGKVSDLLI